MLFRLHVPSASVSRKSTALLAAECVHESSSILFSDAFLRLPIPMVWSNLKSKEDVMLIPHLLLLSQLGSIGSEPSLVDYLLHEQHMDNIISTMGWIEGKLLLDFIRSKLTNFLEEEAENVTFFHEGMISFTLLLFGHLLSGHAIEEFSMGNETWKEDIMQCFVLENIPSYETRNALFHSKRPLNYSTVPRYFSCYWTTSTTFQPFSMSSACFGNSVIIIVEISHH
jgi:hypothetical protein